MRRLRTGLLFVITLLSAFAAAQNYPYVIDKFHTDVVVNADATINVTETIDVTFNESRRGIFRTIPVVYPAGRRAQRALQLKVGSVTDQNGNSQTTKVTREGDNLKIRIGDADVFLPPGTRRTYVFRYSAFGALNWIDDKTWEPWTELYWNVTGDEWDTQITSATFHVSFPSIPADERVAARAFAGPYGSRNDVLLTKTGTANSGAEPYVNLALSSSEFAGTRSRPLAPYEGFTFVLSLPQTVVPRPPLAAELVRRATEYLPLLTPFVVMLVLFPIWRKHGRDKKDGPLQVRFEPPSSLPAAEAGTMLDESVDQRDIAAGIMSLCVNGFLTVELTQKEGFLKKREYALHLTDKKDTTGLSRFEIELYEKLSTCGELIMPDELRLEVAPHIMGIKNTIYQDFVDRGLYIANPNSTRAMAIVCGIAGAILISVILGKLSLVADGWVVMVGAILGLVLAIAFGYQMPKRTHYGWQVRQETLGFFEMMRHREHYMAWVVDKQPDGLKYEEYLPYAVAFDLIEQWSDAFKDIVREPPSWYHDPYGGHFYAHMFARDLRSMASDFGSAATTPPRSSGASGGSSGFSSGGGFSGGGFGGGGGGSW